MGDHPRVRKNLATHTRVPNRPYTNPTPTYRLMTSVIEALNQKKKNTIYVKLRKSVICVCVCATDPSSTQQSGKAIL